MCSACVRVALELQCATAGGWQVGRVWLVGERSEIKLHIGVPEDEVDVRAAGEVPDNRMRYCRGLLCRHHVVVLAADAVPDGLFFRHHTVLESGDVVVLQLR